MAANEEAMGHVLRGACALEQLPPLHKKVVRIFVSSTFSDTKEERNAFMQNVYPRLADLCREKYGLEFQVVDMRWGVPEQAADNHTTTELCLQEIRKCQEVSVGPNFVAIIGNKYGYRPIPSEIPLPEMEALCAVAEEEGDKRWSLVNEWYLRDDNSVPPVYLLQPISRMLPHYNDTEHPELRKVAHKQWSETHDTIIAALRDSARQAHSRGTLSADSKHLFFRSVTESEITHGILDSSSNHAESTICLRRDIPDIQRHLDAPISCKFVNLSPDGANVESEAWNYLNNLRDLKIPSKVPAKNITQVEIDWNASGACVSLEQVENKDILKTLKAADKFLRRESCMSRHKKYLERLCTEMYNRISTLINLAGQQQERIYDATVMEVLQHWHFAKTRCEVFEGRECILENVETYLKSNDSVPFIVYGNSGCGKTSVIANAAKRTITVLSNMVDYTPVVCLRFLGTTTMTSNIQQVVLSLCQQISRACKKEWDEPEKFSELIKSFHELLAKCGQDHKVVLFIDSVDQLMPAFGAYKLTWLPDKLPKNIKIVLSALDEGYEIVKTMRNKYENVGYNFQEVNQIKTDTALCIVQKWLNKMDRVVSLEQSQVVMQALSVCGLPLYARIMFDQVRSWKSYETFEVEQLEMTIKGAINKLFDQMELRFGAPLVKHSLSYLTASRHGLSEVEMEHVLSLDDILLSKIFNFWKPPIRRIPPLLWTRVRSEISSYIVERSADGLVVLYWYHRQFIMVTKDRYLTNDNKFLLYARKSLADFFSGKWGNGKQKPFEYTDAQRKRFNLEKSKSEADRKVPSQKNIIEMKRDGKMTLRFNERRLSELPFHLVKSNQTQELRMEIFFNYGWLYAKLKSTSVQVMLQEFELFMLVDKKLRKDIEMKILFTTLQLIRPYIAKYPDSLPLELTGRLAKYINIYPNITYLVEQCDTQGLCYFPMLPVLTCFEHAQIGLRQNLNFRKTEQWQIGGGMTCSDDFKNIYIIDYDDQGQAQLSTWDIEGGEMLHSVPVLKPHSKTTDEYLECIMHPGGVHILAPYRRTYVQGTTTRYTDDAYVDFIEISTGLVLKSMGGRVYGWSHHNSIYYVRHSRVAIRFGSKVPLFSLFEERTKEWSRPHMTSHDEMKFVSSRNKKAVVKGFSVDDDVVQGSRYKRTIIRDVINRVTIGEIDMDGEAHGLIFTKDDLTLILGRSDGTLQVFDTSRLGEGKTLKPMRRSASLQLPRNEKVTIDSQEVTDLLKTKHIHVRLKLILSPDDTLVLACHQGPFHWEAFLWNIQRCFYIANIARKKAQTLSYPSFTHDSRHIVLMDKHQIHILSAQDGGPEKTYDLSQNIRDLHVSKTSHQVAVLLANDVVFLDSNVKSDPRETKLHGNRQNATRNKKANDLYHDENRDDMINRPILGKQVISATSVLPPIIICDSVDGLEARELDTNTNYSQDHEGEHIPLSTWNTPNGNKIIEVYNKVQVVNLTTDEIKYSPKHGEMLHQANKEAPSNGDGNVPQTTKLEPIDIMKEASTVPIMLNNGDRFTSDNGKVRYRVGDTHMCVMNTPSTVMVSVLSSSKKQRLVELTVYKEYILTVSNMYICTVKTKSQGEFLNVYQIDTGKFLVSHYCSTSVGCVRLSINEALLFMVTRDLVINVYFGENFMKCLCKIDRTQSTHLFSIRDIITFPLDPNAIMVQYCKDGRSEYVDTMVYFRVDLTSKTPSRKMKPNPSFQHISKDSTLAIDSQLTLYDCVSGLVLRSLQTESSDMNNSLSVHARLSDDNQYLVYINTYDDTLHVLQLGKDEESDVHLIQCFAHAPNLPVTDGLTLHATLAGHVICVRGSCLMLFQIMDMNKDRRCIYYSSERSRAWSSVSQTNHKRRTEAIANKVAPKL